MTHLRADAAVVEAAAAVMDVDAETICSGSSCSFAAVADIMDAEMDVEPDADTTTAASGSSFYSAAVADGAMAVVVSAARHRIGREFPAHFFALGFLHFQAPQTVVFLISWRIPTDHPVASL